MSYLLSTVMLVLLRLVLSLADILSRFYESEFEIDF